MDNKKSSPLSQAVRRKSGGSSQLRSPMAKRSPQAPIAQKGWLMKQGSEGLMLWKKRWCVQAEHCLFYYKSPEEEKLLGSILLPSYKVSPCTNDDKVYKKFAFKVEHANMRTYVFAAETREAMVQWMNALSLSTILQDAPRGDDNGFAVTRQPERHFDNMAVNGWLPHQPLYANAPPKPRRMGENSPEPPPDLHPPHPQHSANQHYHPHPYQRPNGFVHPTYMRVPNQLNYQHPNQYYQGYNQLATPPPPPAPSIPPHQVTPRRTYQPPRPHSADFLDYDAKKYYEYQETTVVKTTDIEMDVPVQQRKRPKSSLDIIQNNDDKYYWSEERYAEKMRQSAMYLQQRIASPVRRTEQENFSRSASARLTRQEPEDEESDEVNGYMGGEESMKRLLEWKQRMLASPLTRKPSGSSGRGSANNELSKYYKQQVLRELERQEARNREELGRRRNKPDNARYRSRSTDGRRSTTSVTNRYNSYSSDDEDKGEQTRERSRRPSQIGKTKKINDEVKAQRDTRAAWSPDYENLAEYPERSGRASAPPIKNYNKTPNNDQAERSIVNFPVKNTETIIKRAQQQKTAAHSTIVSHDKAWNEKLDESQLIKEFSYQYINEAPATEKVHSLESPPENIVRSRIKQLGLQVKDLDETKEITMKEPLKVASPSYLLNEAFVSHLRSPDPCDLQERRNNKNIKTFALGTSKPVEPEPSESLEKKSVRDLLADFERKSQLAQERLENEKISEDSMGKRCVFSDTETLLYDTSSDTDEKKPAPDPSILDALRRPDCLTGESADQTEEEGDEEVAATLGRRSRYYSACRELSKKPEPSFPVKNENDRMSIPDSLIANGESESVCSTPTIDMIKDNLEKTLPQENVKKDGEIPEGHYMPMSPARRVSAPPSDRSRSNSSLHSVLFGVEIEETYVEMGDNSSNEYLAKNFATYNNADVPVKLESHYDFLYKSSSQREPEYMEVNNIISALKKESKEKANEDAPPTPPRSALPDILNSSAAQTAKSDSSDADDESSKDLDSLDTPRHPRFSLSDTFRPASYYLGNIMGAVVERSASENHDSSDSDLVSPPPIPTSPPPLEDLDTSLETENSLDLAMQNNSTPTRKLKISDHDLSKRLWSKPRQTDSKRMPVSLNMIESLQESELNDSRLSNSLESAGSRNGMVIDDENCEINLDVYLEDLQLGDPQTYCKDFRSYEMQRNLAENINKCSVSKSLIKPQYQEDAAPEEAEYENLQAMFPPPPPELYESSDQSDRENGISQRTVALDVPPPANYCDNIDTLRPDTGKVRFDPDTLLQKELDAQAPYYYSDIIKADVAGPSCLPTLRQRYQPLNNQREDLSEPLSGSKRNDIGRKVNPIASAEPEERSNVQKITDELKTTSVDFMGDADKTGSVDVRNLYEADTLQRKKAVQPLEILRVRTPDLNHPQGITRNLYPHGIRSKPPEGETQPRLDLLASSSSYGRISQSVEGLLQQVAERPTARLCQVDDAWDEDAIWRENLRRVSRSLDNLDESPDEEPTIPSGRRSVNNISCPSPGDRQSGRRSVDTFTTRPKITRGVTYVNTPTRRSMPSDYENDYREGRRIKKPVVVRELPDSEVQDCDDGVHYERLTRRDAGISDQRRSRRDSSSSGQRHPSDQAPFLEQASHPYIEPIDRERLRQWDLMSSGAGGDAQAARQSGGRGSEQSQPPATAPISAAPLVKPPEASASGSVLREHHLPPPPPPEDTTRPPSRPIPAIMLTEGSPLSSEPRTDHLDPNSDHHMDPKADPRSDSRVNPRLDHKTDHRLDYRLDYKVDPRLDPRMDPRLDHKSDLRSDHTTDHRLDFRSDYKVNPRMDPRMDPRADPRIGPRMVDPRHENYHSMSPYHNSVSPSTPYSTWDSYTPYDGRDRGTHHEHRRPLSEYNQDYRSPHRAPHQVYTKQPLPIGGTLPHSKSPSDSISAGRSSGTLPITRGHRSASRQSDPRQQREYHNPGKREETPGGSTAAGGDGSSSWELDVSAGELLGRTHEELVLLLIQLRRQSAGVCKAMEACHIEIEAQARLAELETPKRMEHLQRLEELKRHLLELEKQYEKGKPLVNLVDNMVKLGSLYRNNDSPSSTSLSAGGHVREKLEFNQKVQEQRMLAQERREWDRLSPDQNQLQAKVQQLYKLDKLLQEESGTLQSLQQDKELLEKALGGLRHKLHVSKGNPQEADRCRAQQKLLQKELSRVRLHLAHNSKKLEETVTENARLEQELVILRQKLQTNRLELSGRGSSLLETSTNSTTQALEAELRRVQGLVGDLQRQRQELSVQVRQLTEKSDTLVQQIRPGPTGVAGAEAVPGKKKSNGSWLETDLDEQHTRDVAISTPSTPTDSPQHLPSPPKPLDSSRSTTPIYINTDLNRTDVASPTQSTSESQSDALALTPVELSEADERMKRYYGIIPREKQEIKTVRIVKRESERRQRDRDRSGNIGLPLGNTAQAKRVTVVDEVDEEEYLDIPDNQPAQDPYAHFHPTNPFLPGNLVDLQKSMSLPRGFGGKAPPPPVRQDHANSLRSALVKRNRVRFETQSQDWSGSDSSTNSHRVDSPSRVLPASGLKSDRPLTAREQLFGTSGPPPPSSSPPLSPVYQSEAARQIVEEMVRTGTSNRRLVPKEKRRHHTVSNIRLFVDSIETPGTSRARDDLDMERALRPRLNAPDVVRSTMSQRDVKYNETTIDSILGTPNKILIPERYIPENEPILTAEEQLHRLRKADSIRKMLSETSALSTPDLSTEAQEEEKKSSTLRKKVDEEKKQREHLLQLNQILAQQVMEKSKLVAGSISSPIPRQE